MTLTEELTTTSKSAVKARLTHIVERDPAGGWLDECLCGYLWDRVCVSLSGDICQECIDELKRRGQG